VLEATIGFNKREEGDDAAEQMKESADASEETEEHTEKSISFTSQDEKFLRSLKITIDD
jgi:hypothetical protein